MSQSRWMAPVLDNTSMEPDPEVDDIIIDKIIWYKNSYWYLDHSFAILYSTESDKIFAMEKNIHGLEMVEMYEHHMEKNDIQIYRARYRERHHFDEHVRFVMELDGFRYKMGDLKEWSRS